VSDAINLAPCPTTQCCHLVNLTTEWSWSHWQSIVKDDHFIPFRSVFETEEQITLQRLMIERRVIRQKFQNFVYNEMRICMSMHLNILCLICINRQYPQNWIKFDNDAWVLLNFQSKYSNNRQSFWQLINRSVQCVLALQSPAADQNLLQLKFCDDTPSAATPPHGITN